MFSLSTNTEAFVSSNAESRRNFLIAISQKLPGAVVSFIGKIQQEQMSGRHGDSGTNIVTNQLRLGWNQPNGEGLKSVSVDQNQYVKAMVWSTTPYAPYHENGGTYQVPQHFSMSRNGKSFSVRAHPVHYTKRLHIGEAWEADFAPSMVGVINDAAAEFLR